MSGSADADAVKFIAIAHPGDRVTEEFRIISNLNEQSWFMAPLIGVTVAHIELVMGQSNANKQLRIMTPKKLPAVFGPHPGT